jgi:DeoR family transcriptional regulator, fructose operon transcriptional repressor
LIIFDQINEESVNFQDRTRQILTLLTERGSAEVPELAAQLHTSEITVRRDLARLAADGLIVRTHGGAMQPGLLPNAVDFAHKAVANVEQKDAICRIAAGLIADGDVLFLDCGSTVARLCPLIRQRPVRVITNSLPVVLALLGSAVRVNLVGGEVDPVRQAVHGLMATEHIARYRADKAFVGVDGLSTNGLSANSETEATLTRSLMAHANQTIALAAGRKIGRDSYVQFAPLAALQTLVTDVTADAATLADLRAQGLTVLH